MRFTGVLQRIAVCYLAVSLLYLWKSLARGRLRRPLVNRTGRYWVLLRWIPVPGAGLPGRDVPSWTCARIWSRGSIGNCSPIICIATGQTTTCAIRKGLLSDSSGDWHHVDGMLTGFWLRTRRSISAQTTGWRRPAAVSLRLGYSWHSGFR